MRANRVLIVATLILGGGLWILLAPVHGTSGLSFALPVAASKLSLDLTTMGAPVLIGLPLAALGSALLAIAFLLAIVEQFRRTPPPIHREEVVVRRTKPFAETDPLSTHPPTDTP